jgi:hypothetical protein
MAFLMVLAAVTAHANSKSKALTEDVADFEFKKAAQPLERSFDFQDGIHEVTMIQAPEPDGPEENFKEIDSDEIAENFSVSGKRKPTAANN